MKAPANGYAIKHRHAFRSIADASQAGATVVKPWVVIDTTTGETVWKGKTFHNARSAHYQRSVSRATGRPISWRQAQRAGNV